MGKEEWKRIGGSGQWGEGVGIAERGVGSEEWTVRRRQWGVRNGEMLVGREVSGKRGEWKSGEWGEAKSHLIKEYIHQWTLTSLYSR